MDDEVAKVAMLCLFPFTIAFAFVVFVFYRSRRETLLKLQEAELRQKVSEVEMKALRSQINPHFIFNCLNSIYQYMERSDVKLAGEYLVKFSKLIRMVLENSIHNEVSLKDDLEALRLYIEMEQMRMVDKFSFSIAIDPDIDVESVLVPPLIIQPFVENSIWHGMNGKTTSGKILICISKRNGMLNYIVEDDGDEQHEHKVLKMHNDGIKKTSLGLTLTQERLSVLNKVKGSDAHFQLSDIRDANNHYRGKRIDLFLPFEDIRND